MAPFRREISATPIINGVLHTPLMAEAEYRCPKCGGPAELDQGYETKVVCPNCGDTRIAMKFLSNGDIETVVENTGVYYELESSVIEAMDRLATAEDGIAAVDAKSRLCEAYAATGREGKAENLSMEVLGDIRSMCEGGVPGMRDRYIDQISVCASFATARGNYKDAADIYTEGIGSIEDHDDIQVASLKVNYGYLCLMRKDLKAAEGAFLDAMGTIRGCFERKEMGDDPYILATVYDSLRMISNKNNDGEGSDRYLHLALEERRRLLRDAPVNSVRLIELADSLGFAAEEEARKGNDTGAEELLEEAISITGSVGGCEDAHAFALMNRAKYRQSRNPEPPEGFKEDMDKIIPALESMPFKDKRTRENIAQAYMFRSMVRDPNEYDGLLADLKGSYETLLGLAQEGDVNEMFFMSSAHSYLVLLNTKDKEKAREVRSQLMDMGISQKDLDRATRGTIGNVSTRKTRVGELSSQQSRPLPGRRLKRRSLS